MALSEILASLRGALAGKNNYTYTAVPAPPLQVQGRQRHVNDRSSRRSRSLKLVAGAATMLAVLALAPVYGYVSVESTRRWAVTGH